MRVELNDEQFTDAASKALRHGITEAMGSWEIGRKLQEAVAECVTQSGWDSLVRSAIEEIDERALTAQVTGYVGPLLVAGMKTVMASAMASVIVDIQTRGEYVANDEKLKRAEATRRRLHRDIVPEEAHENAETALAALEQAQYAMQADHWRDADPADEPQKARALELVGDAIAKLRS